jgi:HEAT repeat protein
MGRGRRSAPPSASDPVDTLVPRLRGENWLVRTEAAWAVWNVAERDPTAVLAPRPALLDRPGDEEPDVRRVAGNALAVTADTGVDPHRDAVRDRLVDGATPKERAGALHCAHRLCTRSPDRTEPLTDAVCECIFDPSERVRSTAADVLETFARLLPGRRDATVDRLLDALEGPDWTVTSAAAEGLAVLAEGFPEYAERFVGPLVETLTHDSKLGPYYSGRSIATFLESVPGMTAPVETRLRRQPLVGDLRVRKNVAMALYELDPDGFENATRVIESVLDALDEGSASRRLRSPTRRC